MIPQPNDIRQADELSKTLWLEFTGKGGHQFMGDLSFDEIVKRAYVRGREEGRAEGAGRVVKAIEKHTPNERFESGFRNGYEIAREYAVIEAFGEDKTAMPSRTAAEEASKGSGGGEECARCNGLGLVGRVAEDRSLDEIPCPDCHPQPTPPCGECGGTGKVCGCDDSGMFCAIKKPCPSCQPKG